MCHVVSKPASMWYVLWPVSCLLIMLSSCSHNALLTRCDLHACTQAWSQGQKGKGKKKGAAAAKPSANSGPLSALSSALDTLREATASGCQAIQSALAARAAELEAAGGPKAAAQKLLDTLVAASGSTAAGGRPGSAAMWEWQAKASALKVVLELLGEQQAAVARLQQLAARHAKALGELSFARV